MEIRCGFLCRRFSGLTVACVALSYWVNICDAQLPFKHVQGLWARQIHILNLLGIIAQSMLRGG